MNKTVLGRIGWDILPCTTRFKEKEIYTPIFHPIKQIDELFEFDSMKRVYFNCMIPLMSVWLGKYTSSWNSFVQILYEDSNGSWSQLRFFTNYRKHMLIFTTKCLLSKGTDRFCKIDRQENCRQKSMMLGTWGETVGSAVSSQLELYDWSDTTLSTFW